MSDDIRLAAAECLGELATLADTLAVALPGAGGPGIIFEEISNNRKNFKLQHYLSEKMIESKKFLLDLLCEYLTDSSISLVKVLYKIFFSFWENFFLAHSKNIIGNFIETLRPRSL
jgi:hypothetical protein